MSTDIKNLYADTNVFLDFLFSRDIDRCNKIRRLFKEASEGKVKITIVSQVIFEIIYVVEKTFGESREETYKHASTILCSKELDVQQRDVLSEMLDIYRTTNFDPVDIYLHCLSKRNNGEVLTFDKDAEKLKRRF